MGIIAVRLPHSDSKHGNIPGISHVGVPIVVSGTKGIKYLAVLAAIIPYLMKFYKRGG